jgi:hypothetical protein
MALMVTVPVREQNARRFLGIAATLGVLGVAFNLNGGDDDNTLPKIMAAAGVAALIWSIHRFGRLGPDEMRVFEEAEADPAPKKKKKKKRKVAADEASSDDGM